MSETTPAVQSKVVLPATPLGNMGRWVTAADGRVIMLRGVNMINKLPPYTPSAAGFGPNDAELLASNGFNVVRVGVIYSAVEPAPGLYDDQYLADIQKTVVMLARHGIMSLIDFHQDGWGPSFVTEGFPEWATLTGPYPIRPLVDFPATYTQSKAVQTAFDNFWSNTPGPGNVGLQDRFAAAWAYAAKTLKSTEGILGWELLNEPFPGSQWQQYEAEPHQYPPLDQALTSFTQKVVNAIRTEDTDHIIWYEPWVTFDAGWPTYIGAIGDPAPVRRIGMAFHNYMKVENYDVNWNNALAHSAATGDALLATEFGGYDNWLEIEKAMNSVDTEMMPAIYWAYWNRTPYQIAKADNLPVSSADMGLVYDPTRPLTPGNVWEDKLTALTRPYPKLIAGTPVSWSFNPKPEALSFHFAWSCKPVGNGITEIFVPNRRYKNGYTVSVTGGTQLPSKDEQVVLISNNDGAETASVDISPR